MQRLLETKRNEIEYFKKELQRELAPENYQRLDNEGYIEDFSKIVVLLNDATVVSNQLGKLNDLLEEELRNKHLLIENDDLRTIPRKPGKDYISNYKVFSDVIEKWAHENGFNLGVKTTGVDSKGNAVNVTLPDYSPEILGFLSVFDFQFLLKHAYLFKDKASMSAHGEFTHTLAIFVLTELQKETPFLNHSMLDIYKRLGTSDCTYAYATPTRSTIWDLLFDQFSTRLNSPATFTQSVIGRRADYPVLEDNKIQILSAIIGGRYDKRLHQEKVIRDTGKFSETIKLRDEDHGLLLDGTIYFKSDDAKLIELTLAGSPKKIATYTPEPIEKEEFDIPVVDDDFFDTPLPPLQNQGMFQEATKKSPATKETEPKENTLQDNPKKKH